MILDKIAAAFDDIFAQPRHFVFSGNERVVLVVREIDDKFGYDIGLCIFGGLDYVRYFIFDIIVFSIAQPREVDDCVHLGSAVANRVHRFKYFGLSSGCALRKADNGADIGPAGEQFCRALHFITVYYKGPKSVIEHFLRVLAHHVIRAAVPQQRMVLQAADIFFCNHFTTSFFSTKL